MKASTEDLLEKSTAWAGWQDQLCKDCKGRITQKMKPVQKAYNSDSKFKRKWADARLANMTVTLWRHLCGKCLKKIRKKAGV